MGVFPLFLETPRCFFLVMKCFVLFVAISQFDRYQQATRPWPNLFCFACFSLVQLRTYINKSHLKEIHLGWYRMKWSLLGFNKTMETVWRLNTYHLKIPRFFLANVLLFMSMQVCLIHTNIIYIYMACTENIPIAMHQSCTKHVTRVSRWRTQQSHQNVYDVFCCLFPSISFVEFPPFVTFECLFLSYNPLCGCFFLGSPWASLGSPWASWRTV